jgi:DNA-binding transcriptional MerR regulator
MGQALKIGQLAQRAAVNLQTIRYYEREGLLPEPPRLSSGYRLYTDSMVRRVRFIKRAQEIGFSLINSLPVCENVRRVIEDAAARATVNEPLAWLSMEPGADQAEVHLAMWPASAT